jgi:hypothetical protein
LSVYVRVDLMALAPEDLVTVMAYDRI